MCFLFLSICRSSLATEFSSFGREREFRFSLESWNWRRRLSPPRPDQQSNRLGASKSSPVLFFFFKNKMKRERETTAGGPLDWQLNQLLYIKSRRGDWSALSSTKDDQVATDRPKWHIRAQVPATGYQFKCAPVFDWKTTRPSPPPPRNKEKKRRRRERERPYLTLELAAFSLVRRPVGSLTVHLSAPPSLERSAFSIVLPPYRLSGNQSSGSRPNCY